MRRLPLHWWSGRRAAGREGTEPARGETTEEIARLLGPDPWCIEWVRHEGDAFEVGGWALPPGGRHEDVAFQLNGRPFDVVEYPGPSGYLTSTFAHRPDAGRAAFTCRSRLARENAYPDGRAALTCVGARSSRPAPDRCTFYYPDDRLGPPLPDLDRQRRVAGGGIAGQFLLAGCSTFVALERALGSTYGKSYRDFVALLDWGCGCGRMTRYFADQPGPAVTGVDIDGDNVAWCLENLPFGAFATVALRPPTALPGASFDLIVGVSVFTHLKEEDQKLWLAELSRLARPGAVLLMTTHGSAAAVRAGMSLSQLRDWIRRGMVYHPGDASLRGHIDDEDYYGTSYVTPQFVREHWSRVFSVDAILPGYIGHHHDLVVMRKPG